MPTFRQLCLRTLQAVATVALCGAAVVHAAGDYPSKPIRFVVPYPPGGGNDLFARLTAQQISESTGQPVVVENRPGAAGQIAGQAVAKAEPDGYTIMVDQNSVATNPLLYRKPLFDARRDLAPVLWGATLDNALLVSGASPIRSLADFIAAAKAKPGSLAYGTPGHGSPQHLAMEVLSARAGIELLHVPFKGTAEIIGALINNDVQLFLISAATASRYTSDGRVRAIATSGEKRSSIMPDVPTISEAGIPGYTNYTWLGIFTTAGTPPSVVSKLNAEFSKALAQPEVKSKLLSQSWNIVAGSPESLKKLVDDEIELYGKVISDLKIQID